MSSSFLSSWMSPTLSYSVNFTFIIAKVRFIKKKLPIMTTVMKKNAIHGVTVFSTATFISLQPSKVTI